MSLFKKITESEIKQSSVASLPTRPTADAKFGGRGLTPQEMKERYDKLPRLIAAYLNLLIDSLEQHYAGGTMPDDIRFDAKSTLREVVNGLQGNVGTLQTDVSTLQTDMSGAKDEITILKDRMEQAETDISTNAGDITRLYDSVDENTTGISDLKDSKLDKTGGTISGDLEVAGNLYVIGRTVESVLEKLNVKDAVIVTNAEGATLAVLSGFATHTGSDTTYGIMYDPASDSVKLGLVTVDENGVYRFAEGEGSPVATRADSADMADGKVVAWNAAKRRIETTEIPAMIDDQPTEGSQNLITSGAVYNAIVQTLNTEV